jgi:hypothetical protein
VSVSKKTGPPTEATPPIQDGRSKDDATPESWVPAEATPADDGRRHDYGGRHDYRASHNYRNDHRRSNDYNRGSNDYRGRYDRWRNDYSAIRPATSKRTAVKTDPASSFGLGAERRQGRAQYGTSKSKSERSRHRLASLSLSEWMFRTLEPAPSMRCGPDPSHPNPIEVRTSSSQSWRSRRANVIADANNCRPPPRLVQTFAIFQKIRAPGFSEVSCVCGLPALGRGRDFAPGVRGYRSSRQFGRGPLHRGGGQAAADRRRIIANARRKAARRRLREAAAARTVDRGVQM